jgi:hypothetical protein
VDDLLIEEQAGCQSVPQNEETHIFICVLPAAHTSIIVFGSGVILHSFHL